MGRSRGHHGPWARLQGDTGGCIAAPRGHNWRWGARRAPLSHPAAHRLGTGWWVPEKPRDSHGRRTQATSLPAAGLAPAWQVSTLQGAHHQPRPSRQPWPWALPRDRRAGQLTTDNPGLRFWGLGPPWGWADAQTPPGLEPESCTWAFWATSSTSWNFSDTVKSSFGGSCSQRGQRISTGIQQPRAMVHRSSPEASQPQKQGPALPPHRGAGCPGRRPPGAREGRRAVAVP